MTTERNRSAGEWWSPGPAPFLITAATTAAGLSVISLWWALPTAVAAFLAGLRPGRARSVTLVLVAVLAIAVVAVSVVPSWIELGSRFVAVVVGAAMLPWFAGRFWLQYRELVRAGWERASQLEREQRLVAEQARLRERARIAQDMHDVLGHDLSLIALSAGALKLAPDLPDAHRAAAQDMRARAAAAVERLGEVIGVLREEADGAPTQPAGEGIADLVGRTSAAGLAVTLRVEGQADDLPPMVERAAHRVVQESLTNVTRHAPGAAAVVRVRHTATETEVLVENGPAPDTADPAPRGGGRGLIGLDERVRRAGGSLTYRPSGGGFTVLARLPHTPSAQPSHPSDPAPPGDAVPREHRRARRRLGRTLVTALMLPLVTGALLGGVLRGSEILTVRQSVLVPADYARIQIGQDHSKVEQYLPDRQTTHRPGAAEPKEQGMTCEYYAITADPFDDRSGDAYRLCFQTGKLVSADSLAG
ncbi:sensor histidine kinase [Streptosporangium sp. 'caverna']|uniref:sensor histidine kinase n=1 Tax=Streptosporangium sp. 'caverna' TaxID=2202249 RepID=UPI000D7D54DE|nr:histidine kinase [Streptosporangium sp. 'caverna']AWS46219.1 sensor histidine kinase [Streptosporangium sp. 'caverna']